MEFSIIIPIYNSEDYLRRCIESCRNQTFRDIEIILVNDGSTDASEAICQDFAKKDLRIVYVKKENGGLSDARNYGLKKATGDYIVFLDSDDFLSPDACERFHKVILRKRADIICGTTLEERDGNISRLTSSKDGYGKHTTGARYLRHELGKGTFRVMACTNIYRRLFLIEKHLFFKKGIFHEDVEWSPRVFLEAACVVDTDNEFYHYMIREGSITRKKSFRKNYEDVSGFVPELEKRFCRIEDTRLQGLLMDYLCMIYLSTFYRAQVNESEPLPIDRRMALRLAKTGKNKGKAFLVSLSPRGYCRMNQMVKKMMLRKKS